MASPPLFHRNRPRVLNNVNENYCVKCVTRLKDCACVSGKTSLNPSPVMAGNKDLTSNRETVNLPVNSCVENVHSVNGLPQKKGIIPHYCHNYTEIKYVKDVACVGHLSSVNLVTNVPTVAIDRSQTAPVLGKMGSPGSKSQDSNSTQRRLHPSLQVQTQLDQVTHCHKQLLQSPQKPPLVGGLASAGEPKCSRTGSNSKITAVLQQAIFGTQTQQRVGTYLGPEHLEHLPKHRVIQNGDTRDNKNRPTGRGVGYLHRFQRRILPHTNSQSVQEVHAFSCPGSVLPVQSPTLWPVHSTKGFTVVAKEVKLMALQRGIRIHQYLDDWLVRARSHHTCLQHTQTLVALYRELDRLVNKEKSELDPKQVFNLVGYQFDLRAEGKIRPTPEHWQASTDKIHLEI